MHGQFKDRKEQKDTLQQTSKDEHIKETRHGLFQDIQREVQRDILYYQGLSFIGMCLLCAVGVMWFLNK
jgi:hypothetical protein